MRLWTLHPRYLDSKGLVALWREALLARAVLRGKTKGYRSHPQLDRFRSHRFPISAINAYLLAVYSEAAARGYAFDRTKLGAVRSPSSLIATRGQMAHEWKHLLLKLEVRDPKQHARWCDISTPQCHPIFTVRAGPIVAWERG